MFASLGRPGLSFSGVRIAFLGEGSFMSALSAGALPLLSRMPVSDRFKQGDLSWLMNLVPVICLGVSTTAVNVIVMELCGRVELSTE